ncbi:Elongation factor 3 [Phytophthora palmivora]|uniref:Elongation factor 3 n=1 Tax=Phytophthora palmivora TaxID=4796 RepID=A0A2P4XR08_9STRA|nr:Elongation factor 3 [Phytophthora palmivora]
MVVAYVVQHSFHHVEKHLDSSPVEYFQWRFGGENGIDRELGDHVNLQQTEEEKNLVGKKQGQFGTHGKIRGLSGGQKVKLVIAAAMWNRPHLLVLDEPTNYLDRAALGALADGIHQYAGGVIMISHSEEFYNSLCTEKWLVESGRLTIIGEAQEKEYRAGGGRKVVH